MIVNTFILNCCYFVIFKFLKCTTYSDYQSNADIINFILLYFDIFIRQLECFYSIFCIYIFIFEVTLVNVFIEI